MAWVGINGMRSARYPMQGLGATPAQIPGLADAERIYRDMITAVNAARARSNVPVPAFSVSAYQNALRYLPGATTLVQGATRMVQMGADQVRALILGAAGQVALALGYARSLASSFGTGDARLDALVTSMVLQARLLLIMLQQVLNALGAPTVRRGTSGLGITTNDLTSGYAGSALLFLLTGPLVFPVAYVAALQSGILNVRTAMGEAQALCAARARSGNPCGARELVQAEQAIRQNLDANNPVTQAVNALAVDNPVTAVSRGIETATTVLIVGGISIAVLVGGGYLYFATKPARTAYSIAKKLAANRRRRRRTSKRR